MFVDRENFLNDNSIMLKSNNEEQENARELVYLHIIDYNNFLLRINTDNYVCFFLFFF